MNREYKKEELKNVQMPKTLDSVDNTDEGVLIEYDGWHFEGKTTKAVVNKVLKYIFKGGED